MTAKIYGKPTFGGKTIPIALLTDPESIKAAATQSRPKSDLTVGIPLGGPNTSKEYQTSVIVAPYELVVRLLAGTARASYYIDVLLSTLRNEISAMSSLTEQRDVLKRASAGTLFPYRVRDKVDGSGHWTAEQLWSATIVGWAIARPSDPYWSGRVPLWESFMRWLGVRIGDTRTLSPFRETYANVVQIEQSLFGNHETDLYMELGAWIQMDTEYKEAMAQLATVGELYEAYAKLWITIILMLATAGTSVWLKVAGEVLEGVIDVAAELEKASRDGVISEDETGGIIFAGVFAVLPLSALLKDGRIKSLLRFFEGMLLILIIGLFVISIFRELLYSVGVMQRRGAAQKNGITTLDEYALDQWIVIQYTD